MSEQTILRSIEKLAGKSSLVLGIGDDCAIYRPRANEDLLFTTDQMIEGVHFSDQSPQAIGARALARSLSDIAAMGGTPRFCLVALAAKEEKWIGLFYRGLLKLAKKTGTALAGGDLARADRIYMDVMVCGTVERGRALRRDGARPGDSIYVSGRLGKAWDRPIVPRLTLGRQLLNRATSCIDLSDGLSLDLHRLCLASNVAAEIESIPVAKGSTLDRAWNGGEDYELLFTLPPRKTAPLGVYKIGSIVSGPPGAIRFQGRVVAPRGYDHFRNG